MNAIQSSWPSNFWSSTYGRNNSVLKLDCHVGIAKWGVKQSFYRHGPWVEKTFLSQPLFSAITCDSEWHFLWQLLHLFKLWSIITWIESATEHTMLEVENGEGHLGGLRWDLESKAKLFGTGTRLQLCYDTRGHRSLIQTYRNDFQWGIVIVHNPKSPKPLSLYPLAHFHFSPSFSELIHKPFAIQL